MSTRSCRQTRSSVVVTTDFKSLDELNSRGVAEQKRMLAMPTELYRLSGFWYWITRTKPVVVAAKAVEVAVGLYDTADRVYKTTKDFLSSGGYVKAIQKRRHLQQQLLSSSSDDEPHS